MLLPEKGRGFTLVEMLVIIAIISLISSIVLGSLNAARARGRDSKRVQEMASIMAALELYHTDTGHYYCTDDWTFSSDSQFLSGLVTGKYITSTPTDPSIDHNPLPTDVNPLYPYWYASFRAYPGGQCGAYYVLQYDSEAGGHTTNTQCGLSGGDGRWISPTHCHFDYPTAVPCSDPYFQTAASPDCELLKGT